MGGVAWKINWGWMEDSLTGTIAWLFCRSNNTNNDNFYFLSEPNQDHNTDVLFPLQNKQHQGQSQIKEEAMEVINPRLEDEASHTVNSPHDQTVETAENQAPSSDSPVTALINRDNAWNPCLEEHQVVRDDILQEQIKEEVKEVMIPRIEDEAYPSVKSHYDQSVETADNQALFSEYSSTAIGSQLISSPLPQSQACSFQADSSVPAPFEYLISAKVSVDTICDVCGKRCGSKNGLTDHLQTHPEVKFCHVCCACFKKDIELIRHMEGNHEGEKPFKCHECGKAFLRRDNLVMHIRIHTGEKPFGCPFCGRSFAQSSYLSIHKRLHTGEKPYCCRVCGKGYSKRASVNNCLREHRRKNDM